MKPSTRQHPGQTHTSPILVVMGETVRGWKPTPRVATGAIVATSIAYAFATFFARRLTDAGLSPIAVAFYRFAISAALLVRVVNFAAEKRRATAWGLLSGFGMGAGWIAYVHTIETGDVATAAVAYMTYPLFALIAGRLFFGIGLSPRAIVGAGLVLLAAAVGIGAAPAGGLSPVVLIAPATFGFAVTVLTERLDGLDPFERLGAVALGSTAGMSPLLLTIEIDEIFPSSASGWIWILGIGLVAAFIPMLVYAAAAPSVGSARTAVAGAAELPTVFLIGAAFFGESVRPGHGLAAVLIVVAVALTPTGRPRSGVKNEIVPDIVMMTVGRLGQPAPPLAGYWRQDHDGGLIRSAAGATIEPLV